jgi:2,5-dihydroxypyridine 5,6-dioxygenase
MPNREFGIGDGIVLAGEVRTLPGQVGWAPKFDTINGVITFDASIVPAVGILSNPVSVHVKNGRCVRIEGGQEAAKFEKWLNSFDDPRMFNLVHVCYGFGPNAILSGRIIEDERIWGSTEWGFGNLGACLTIPDIPEGIAAASHCDGICLNSTVYLDGVLFLLNGEVVGPTPDVVALAEEARAE